MRARIFDSFGIVYFLVWLFFTGSVIVLALALLYVVIIAQTWRTDR